MLVRIKMEQVFEVEVDADNIRDAKRVIEGDPSFTFDLEGNAEYVGAPVYFCEDAGAYSKLVF